jgi:hypothetical protein
MWTKGSSEGLVAQRQSNLGGRRTEGREHRGQPLALVSIAPAGDASYAYPRFSFRSPVVGGALLAQHVRKAWEGRAQEHGWLKALDETGIYEGSRLQRALLWKSKSPYRACAIG